MQQTGRRAKRTQPVLESSDGAFEIEEKLGSLVVGNRAIRRVRVVTKLVINMQALEHWVVGVLSQLVGQALVADDELEAARGLAAKLVRNQALSVGSPSMAPREDQRDSIMMCCDGPLLVTSSAAESAARPPIKKEEAKSR